MERILFAAIAQDGAVFTGRRHSQIIRDVVFQTGTEPVTGAQGFTTDAGRFVSRTEAARIALACGQITQPKKLLFSEDLW